MTIWYAFFTPKLTGGTYGLPEPLSSFMVPVFKATLLTNKCCALLCKECIKSIPQDYYKFINAYSILLSGILFVLSMTMRYSSFFDVVTQLPVDVILPIGFVLYLNECIM